MLRRAWDDIWVRRAMLAAFFLRVLPMVVWNSKPCVRDECTYEDIAQSLMMGDGMIGTQGWLWAPAYPSLMAVHGIVTGLPRTIQVTQLAVSMLMVAMLFQLATQLHDRRSGRIAAWAYAINPTYAFYATSQWSETLYAALLCGAVMALGWAREGSWRRAWLPGFLVGSCVLFRGVATYLLPIFLIGLLWERVRHSDAWRAAALCALTAALTVAPYSAYATHKFGGTVISDRTMGQMMWLGNNDFPPVTFDWGNGVLRKRHYNRLLQLGRPHCKFTANPVLQDACETANGIQWIKDNPEEFARRIPMRVAQMFNPHSFLSRHLRWGRWTGMPDLIKEGLLGAVVLFSFGTLVGGTVGMAARGRGWYAVTASLIVLYHVGAIAMLAGLTRYRVPLEPLWLVMAAPFFADRSGVLRELFSSRWRTASAFVVCTGLIGFMMVYLPSAWPEWVAW